MAVDAPFPSLGEDPWGGKIIPWAEQVRENVNELDQVVIDCGYTAVYTVTTGA